MEEKMKTTIKQESKTKVKVTIALAKEEITLANNKAVKELSKGLKLAGFRKGKIPKEVAKKHLNPNSLEEQTIDMAVSQAVADVFLANELRALERPAVAILKSVPGEVLEFTATAEVMPEIKLGNYKKIKLDEIKTEVSDKEVADSLARIQESLAEKKTVTRLAKTGDETVIDFIGKKKGKAFEGGTGHDYPLKLGSGQFIPGFEEQIIGHKAGEEFTIKLTFPKDYGVADLNGQAVTFDIKLKEVKELKLPKLDDAFAKKVGNFKTLAELKADILRELTNQKQHQGEEKQKEAVLDKLIEISDIPTPEVLIDDHVKMIRQDFENNIKYRGITFEQYLKTNNFKDEEDWLNKEIRVIADKRVRVGLALAELSRLENILIDPRDVEKSLDSYRQHYSKNKEMLAQFDRPEVKQDIANRLLVEKTIQHLINLNK